MPIIDVARAGKQLKAELILLNDNPKTRAQVFIS